MNAAPHRPGSGVLWVGFVLLVIAAGLLAGAIPIVQCPDLQCLGDGNFEKPGDPVFAIRVATHRQGCQRCNEEGRITFWNKWFRGAASQPPR